jgi:hypothetical protein
MREYGHIYVLARALVMLAKKLGIFATAQVAHKNSRIYACIYASVIQA